MTTKQFIEKAIEGGYKEYDLSNYIGDDTHSIAWLFLDTLAWQAVGKVEGWGIVDPHGNKQHHSRSQANKYIKWQWCMHAMIDHLIYQKLKRGKVGMIFHLMMVTPGQKVTSSKPLTT